jgi:hypothetical protein
VPTPTKRPKAKPAPRDPFGGYWSFDGSLAEVTRANKVKMTPAVYAAASMDTMLLEDGGHVRVDKDARVYTTSAKQDVATMRLSGDVLIVQFIAPRESDALARAKRFYKAVKGKPGWLEFRRPATRDPRPALDADLGAVVGQAVFERRRRKNKAS